MCTFLLYQYLKLWSHQHNHFSPSTAFTTLRSESQLCSAKWERVTHKPIPLKLKCIVVLRTHFCVQHCRHQSFRTICMSPCHARGSSPGSSDLNSDSNHRTTSPGLTFRQKYILVSHSQTSCPTFYLWLKTWQTLHRNLKARCTEV